MRGRAPENVVERRNTDLASRPAPQRSTASSARRSSVRKGSTLPYLFIDNSNANRWCHLTPGCSTRRAMVAAGANDVNARALPCRRASWAAIMPRRLRAPTSAQRDHRALGCRALATRGRRYENGGSGVRITTEPRRPNWYMPRADAMVRGSRLALLMTIANVLLQPRAQRTDRRRRFPGSSSTCAALPELSPQCQRRTAALDCASCGRRLASTPASISLF